MEDCDSQTGASKPDIGANGGERQGKRATALAEKLSALQADRKSKLDNASVIRNSMDGLKHDIPQLKNALRALVEKCNDAKRIHESLLTILPGEEGEKHDVWFKAKIVNNDVIGETKVFLMGVEKDQTEVLMVVNADSHANDQVNAGDGCEASCQNVEPVPCVHQNDSVSNIASKRSHKSGRSSTSSARRLAEAERAALIARAAALKEKHAIEVQEQQLSQRKQQLDLDAELAASEAKLAVLQASEGSRSSASSGSRSSKLHVKKVKVINLDPNALEYQPEKPLQPPNNILLCAESNRNCGAMRFLNGTNSFHKYNMEHCMDNNPHHCSMEHNMENTALE